MKEQIQVSLQAFAAGDVADNARNLFQTLGYNTTRQAPFDEKTFDWFRENYFQPDTNFNVAKALADKWNYVDLLFQLSAEELQSRLLAFDTRQVDEARIESYLFFAIGLPGREYTRTALADITRELNKVFPMPCFVLFAYDDKLTLAVVNRRLHRRDESRDVLLKVTLIKDINTTQPKRSHIEILHDLALPELQRKHRFTNFVELHEAWQKTLDTKELNKRFFQELANWYFWAVQNVTFPDGVEKNEEVRNATSVIRLITRLIFVWFLQEKGLVSDDLFNRRKLSGVLRFKDESAFYKGVLQNLFFATLNSQMGERKFIAASNRWGNAQHFVHNVLRYQSEFIAPETALHELFAPIPFLNGGLFECLDKEENGQRIRVDGFSDHPKNVLRVPDELFFGAEREVDLSVIYGDKKKAKAKVLGLLNILDNYKFTIAENTPLEEEIALDPELLGKVFENLLANYNPETKTTARKQTGSFYTPREIVNYMVDESLIAYLKAKLQTETVGFQAINTRQPDFFGNAGRKQLAFEEALSGNRWQGQDEELEKELRRLFAYEDLSMYDGLPACRTSGNSDRLAARRTLEHDFNDTETEILIKAIDECKILDPACGSGAFPMGVLHRLVFLLGKLDPRNEKWRDWQKLKAIEETRAAYDIGGHHERETRLREINDIFDLNASDYGRKLFLIENCIYGVDIQPIAIQIAKLRFFISLIVDQKANPAQDNLGVRPLPNLETKFVAANTLIGLEHLGLKPNGMDELEQQLKEVRAAHFRARTRKTKEKYRAEDERLRNAIAELLKHGGINPTSADLVAAWNPYDQNASAPWFDAEWMFGLEKGFDIVIGNPPYGFHQIHSIHGKSYFKQHYVSSQGSFEHYFLFYECSLKLLNGLGHLAFIAPVTWLTIPSAFSLRKFVIDNFSIGEICWLSEQVFEHASVNTLISLIHARPSNEIKIKNYDLLDKFPSNPLDLRKITKSQIDSESYAISIFTDTKDEIIVRKMRTNSRPLSDYARPCSGYNPYEVGGGLTPDGTPHDKQTIIDKPYHSKKKLGSDWKPEIIGKNLKRYALTVTGERWVKYGKWLAAPRDPENFRGKRILVQEITGGQDKRIVAVYCDEELYHSRDVIPIKMLTTFPHPLFLLGLINSKLFSWYHLKCNPKSQKGLFPKILVSDLKKLPIRKLDQAAINDKLLHHQIVEVVEEILAAKRADARADTSEAERRIDELVYALYGLDAAEIAIVEGKV